MFSRRLFLKNSAIAMFGMGSVPAWLSRAVYAEGAPGQRKKILIAIFQRGAVDGLNVVVPHGERAYYASRPTIAIPHPDGTEQGAIDLNGHFGLHPSLKALKPLWDRQELAIVEAVGSPDPSRSHFDAQDYMESGTPGLKSTSDGWLNRAMQPEAQSSPVRAISLSPALPRTLRGKNEALTIANLNDFQVKDAALSATFESMYGTAGREAFDAIRIVQSIPQSGAPYPKGRLGQSLRQIARVIKADVGLEVAFTDTGGWDTHVNESGQLANLLRDFGDALAAFSNDMGDRMADITVVTMSEFGRTVKENGNQGTDHGHANVMFVFGGSVRGGRIYGEWPGLEREQLYEGRDLNVTTDFRAVLSELVTKQMGNPAITTVFPGFKNQPHAGLLKT